MVVFPTAYEYIIVMQAKLDLEKRERKYLMSPKNEQGKVRVF